MTGTAPRYFLLKSESHYFVAQTIVAVEHRVVPAAVSAAVDAAIEGTTTYRAAGLPGPGDPCKSGEESGWAFMAAMQDFGPMDDH